MSFTYSEIENRIQQAIEYLKENSDAKRAKVARDFDVSSQRLRFRLLWKILRISYTRNAWQKIKIWSESSIKAIYSQIDQFWSEFSFEYHQISSYKVVYAKRERIIFVFSH